MHIWKKAGLGVVLAATTLTAVAPAEAQRWRRHHRGGGDVAAGALIGGIVGLAAGAAIASNNRDRYWDRGYYYGPDPRFRGYYAPPPPRYYRPYRGYHRDRFYAPPRYRGYYDPYYGW